MGSLLTLSEVGFEPVLTRVSHVVSLKLELTWMSHGVSLSFLLPLLMKVPFLSNGKRFQHHSYTGHETLFERPLQACHRRRGALAARAAFRPHDGLGLRMA